MSDSSTTEPRYRDAVCNQFRGYLTVPDNAHADWPAIVSVDVSSRVDSKDGIRDYRARITFEDGNVQDSGELYPSIERAIAEELEAAIFTFSRFDDSPWPKHEDRPTH